jgi:glycosyltransferase involved in cell wall biosynthesis
MINLTGGGFSGGYRKYLKNMLPRLVEHCDVDALLCVYPEGNDITKWFRQMPAADYCTCNPLTLSHFAHIPDRKMAECLRVFSPDIVFLPVDRYIRHDGVPVVNMVRNMEPFVPNMRGDTLQEMFRKFIQRKLTGNSVRRADHTIAVSGFVKDYLTVTLHAPENKVSQVYHGLTLSPIGSCIRPVSIPIGWDGGFLFTCGSVRPARGLEDVLEALSYLKAQNMDLRLIIAGETVPGMRKYRDGLERLLASRGLTDNVCWAGNLKDEEIRWCYDRCSLFIMTSRIEACPNIALEAMSHGCVSISTDSLPMPEFFGDAAVYYSRGDVKSLCSAIQSVLTWNDEHRKEISERATMRASQFSWDSCAEKTVEALKKVIMYFNNRNGKGK